MTVAVEAAGGRATVRVRGTGVGIAADRLGTVFDLFSPDGRPPPSGAHGLGVGLAVVRELVARHGGSVQARSEGDGRGSEFVVALPTRPGVEAADSTWHPHCSTSGARSTPKNGRRPWIQLAGTAWRMTSSASRCRS